MRRTKQFKRDYIKCVLIRIDAREYWEEGRCSFESPDSKDIYSTM